MPDADAIRKQQLETWDRFSAGWIKWDRDLTDMLAPVGQEMIRSLALTDDGAHLDIASGTGEPGLSIAAEMPRGRVVLTDLSGDMLAGATTKAKNRALANVEVRVCGVDDLDFDDASFDTVSCRFGFMFFPDIRGAVAELVRMLRPGGRISAAVWAEPAGNAWATIPMEAISAEIEPPSPEPDAPGLFRFGAPGSVAAIYREAGLHDVTESDVRGSLELDDADQYWSFLIAVSAPIVAVLAGVDTATSERIRAATIQKAHAFEKDGRLSLPLHARCIVGSR
jgi:SAM-dependent methyltransferase